MRAKESEALRTEESGHLLRASAIAFIVGIIVQVWNAVATVECKPESIIMFRVKRSGFLGTTTVGRCKANRLHVHLLHPVHIRVSYCLLRSHI